jgi:hypothetical protein
MHATCFARYYAVNYASNIGWCCNQELKFLSGLIVYRVPTNRDSRPERWEGAIHNKEISTSKKRST